MKIRLFNDTSEDWVLHVGSEEGVNGEDCINVQESVVFDVPLGFDAFVKIWDGLVMVKMQAPSMSEGKE